MEGFAVVGIERGKEFFIPSEDSLTIEPGDLIYFFGDEAKIRTLCPKLDPKAPDEIERCVIFGAGDLGISIARRLLENGIEVKLIDKDLHRCQVADEALEGEVMTFSCKYGTGPLFEEEGLKHADMIIAATADDEYNIIKCLEAMEYGINKVVAVNNELEYYTLMHRLGIVVVRGPKMSTYHRIIERIHSSRVLTERKYGGGQAALLLRKIFPASVLIGTSVKPKEGRKGTLLFLVRGERLIPWKEAIVVEEGDILAAFALEEDLERVENWLYGL